jgi:hypothetical protein
MKDEAYINFFMSGPSKELVEAFMRKVCEMADKEGITMREPTFIEVLGMVADHKL